jgi:hypothetical protein
MILALLIAAAAVPEEADLPAFQPAAERFADAGACRAHLAAVVAAARAARFDAAEGPIEWKPATCAPTRCGPKAPATASPNIAARPSG